MNASPMRKCPLCLRPLTEHDRVNMGLRSGDMLSALCPGRIGPSDIDHVIHNGASYPQRLAVIEYKGGAPVGIGQRILFGAIAGEWRDGKRALDIRVFIIEDDHEPAAQLAEAVGWTFAGRRERRQPW